MEVVPGRFVALDFETADYYPDSACALAVVVVDGDAVVDRKYVLIRPPRPRVVLSYVHKITWEHVAGQYEAVLARFHAGLMHRA